MRIAICDDEKQQRMILQRLVKQSRFFLPQMEIVEFSSGEELIHSIVEEKMRYSIIFLDIAMGEINGIEAARKIRLTCKDTIIIFITGLMDYVLQAFEVKAFRYLIKPVSQVKFDKELNNALSEISGGKDKQYIINANERTINLSIDELYYIESNLRKITVYTQKECYTLYGKFEEQESKLSRHGFMTVHRGILVNLAHIKTIEKNMIYLKNGFSLPLSRNRRKDVYDAFTNYMLESAL